MEKIIGERNHKFILINIKWLGAKKLERDFNNTLDLIERLDLKNDEHPQVKKNRKGNNLICWSLPMILIIYLFYFWFILLISKWLKIFLKVYKNFSLRQPSRTNPTTPNSRNDRFQNESRREAQSLENSGSSRSYGLR